MRRSSDPDDFADTAIRGEHHVARLDLGAASLDWLRLAELAAYEFSKASSLGDLLQRFSLRRIGEVGERYPMKPGREVNAVSRSPGKRNLRLPRQVVGHVVEGHQCGVV